MFFFGNFGSVFGDISLDFFWLGGAGKGAFMSVLETFSFGQKNMEVMVLVLRWEEKSAVMSV